MTSLKVLDLPIPRGFLRQWIRYTHGTGRADIGREGLSRAGAAETPKDPQEPWTDLPPEPPLAADSEGGSAVDAAGGGRAGLD